MLFRSVLVDESAGFDPAAERDRIGKRHEAASVELEKLDRKLANEGFLAKAAPEIVEKDRTKAAELRDTVLSLQAQLLELAE